MAKAGEWKESKRAEYRAMGFTDAQIDALALKEYNDRQAKKGVKTSPITINTKEVNNMTNNNNNEMPTSVSELEALLEAKKTESAEAFASGNYSRMAELGQELTTIQTNLENAKKAANNANSGIDASALKDIMDSNKRIESALQKSLSAQATLVSEIRDLKSTVNSQADKIGSLESTVAKLMAEIEKLKANNTAQVEKIQGTNEEVEKFNTENVDHSEAPAPETKKSKKGATAQFKEEQKRMEENLKNGIAQEYNDMVARQGMASAIRDFVNRYPDFDSMPEWLQDAILDASKNDNDVYHIIAQNMDIWEEETRQRAMAGAVENPTDEQIRNINVNYSASNADITDISSDIGNLNDFESIFDND